MRLLCLVFIYLGLALPVRGATTVIEELGANHRTWSRGRNAIDGESGVRASNDAKRRITEIATGMNYWDGQEWVPSVAKFEATKTGFEATKMQHVVSLHGNLNRIGSVSVQTHDGITLHSTPVAIGLYDAKTGDALIIAAINNSVGVQVADNKVFFENAFIGLNGEGMCADVLYTIERGSFEQDVIIRGKLDPEAYGFSKETARIQIYTEFYQAPQPQRIRRPIRVEDRETVRLQMAKPDLVDEVLGFGEFVLATGRAFPAGTMPEVAAAPVAKEFVARDQRIFLIETVEYASVQKHFEDLPPCNPRNADLKRGRFGRKRNLDFASIPTAAPRSGITEKIGADENAVRVASAKYLSGKGVVIDYIATIGGTLNTTTVFQGDTTYFVSGPVICNGAATIEGGAVFKFKHQSVAPVGYASIKFNSTVTCKTSSHRPAIFTAVDDDSVGQTLNGYAGSGYQQPVRTDGYANPALWIYNLSSQQLSNLRFTYCQEAIRVEGGSANTLTHAQLVKCIRGIVITGGGGCGGSGSSVPITVNNGLFANVSSPITLQRSSSTANFYHCTVESTPAVGTVVAATATSACNFFNSVLANVTAISSGPASMGGSNNGFYQSPQFGTGPVSSPSTPFRPPVGAGNYYLVEGSSFRDKGATAGLSSSLLSDLSKRTVDPPTVLSPTTYSSSQIFSPQVVGDMGNPDLGYHYSILDYLASGLGAPASGAPLIVTNGATIAFYGNSGFIIPDGGMVAVEGTATAMSRLVWYPSVQEQPVLLDNVATWFSIMFDPLVATGTSPGTVKPTIRMRFAEVVMLGFAQSLVWALPRNLNTLSIKDCWLKGADITIAASVAPFPEIAIPTMTIWNNALERSRVSALIGYRGSSDTPLGGVFVNNLVWQSVFQFDYQAQGAAHQPTWTIQANLFDNASVSFAGNGNYQSLVNRSFNAFYNASSASLEGSGNVVLTALAYATGPNAGQWYIGSSTPSLQNIDTSRTGGAAGLYHYTIYPSQTPEMNSSVDIGFHYVATTPNGVPVDTDGDGIPDYLEDSNRDGDLDAGETDHQVRDDSADYDSDGLSNLEEQQLGFDPLLPPLSIGRKLWLRAHGTVSTVSGSVAEWGDDSGNGNHLSQSQLSARPTLVADVQNGKPAVYFAGDDVLKAAGQVSMIGRVSASWLMVVRPTVVAYGQILENRQIHLKWRSGESIFQAYLHHNGNWDQPGTIPNTPADYPANQTYVVLCTYDSLIGRQRIYVNGSLVTDTPASGPITSEGGSADWLALRIGSTAFNADFYNGYVMESMIYGHALSADERDLMHRYLQQKYGLSLSPIPKTGQKLWLRADAGVTRDANNVAVNRWIDQSGEGNDVLQTSGTAAQPSFVYSGMNSKPVVRFNGDDFLKAAGQVSLNGKMSGTWLAVVRQTGAGLGQILENRQIYIAASSGEAVFGVDAYGSLGWVHGGGGPYTPLGDYPYNSIYVVMGIYDHTAGKHRIFVNSELAQEWPSKGAISTPPGQPADYLKLRVGVGLNPGNLAYFQGDIAEVMIYDHALTQDERTAIEGYLQQKYAVALLPLVPTIGQKLWLRADAGVNRDADNVTVNRWLDQSPDRNHAAQTSGTTPQPAYVINGLNGQPVIRFDGVNDVLKCTTQADLGGKTSGSWLAVVKPTGGGVSQILENRQVHMAWRGGDNAFGLDVFRVPGWVHGGGGPFTPTTYPPNLPYTILGIYDGVLGKHRIYVNGTLVTEASPSPATISSASAVTEERKLKIGAYYDGVSAPFTGDIIEVLIYDRGLTAAERQTIDQYLASKYGTLDLDFDEDHVVDTQDIDLNDPSLGRLTITIEQPANGSTIY